MRPPPAISLPSWSETLLSQVHFLSASSFSVNEHWHHHPPGTSSPPLPCKCFAKCKGLPCSTLHLPCSVLSQLCEQPQVACNCPNAHFTTTLQLIAAQHAIKGPSARCCSIRAVLHQPEHVQSSQALGALASDILLTADICSQWHFPSHQ